MKKNSRYLIIIAILSFAAFIAGCKSYTEGYDVNPIAPISAPANMTFAGAQGAFDEFMEGFPSQDAAMWTQQATGTDRQFTGYYHYTTSA